LKGTLIEMAIGNHEKPQPGKHGCSLTLAWL
jgi:hypothetical protein